MKAVVLRTFGGPDELVLAEVADPVAGPGEVLVAVWAAGTNPVDAGNRQDGSWAGLSAPCVLGYDVAGVVQATGPGVEGLAVGDRVMAMTGFPGGARSAPAVPCWCWRRAVESGRSCFPSRSTAECE